MYPITQYINEVIGRAIESDGSPVGSPTYKQCTDEANDWLEKNGLPKILGRNAIDFQTAPGYQFVRNTPTYLPPIGSIAVYAVGQYGHVDIVAPGTNLRDLVCLSQNWPIGANVGIVTHRNYASVIGFLLLPASKTYTVVAGDNLSKIALSHGTDYHTLASINGIAPPYVIHPGQVIKLP